MTPTVTIPSDTIRRSAVAGQFYPESPTLLRQQIDELLQHAETDRVDGEVLALIAPHAGYVYSGQTAANAYKQVAGRRVATVFVLAPSHWDAFEGVSVYTGSGYETPLGVVPVDREKALALIEQEADLVHATLLGHRREHSLEVQLPFLQCVLPPAWRLVPLVMYERSPDVCRRLASAIAAVSQETDRLIVASSDLYHGYSYRECTETDERTLRSLERFDPDEFLQGVNTEVYAACGGGPITVAMLAAKQLGADTARVTAHTTSGDVTGQRDGYIVGYGAAVIYRKAPETQSTGPPGLNEAERRQLLTIARTAIAQCAQGVFDAPVIPCEAASEKLLAPCGAFVTLRHDDTLRGCIGSVQAVRPLYLTVQDMARAAATQDPRFPPVTPDELVELRVEISVLGPLRRLDRLDDLHIGTHGLYIRGQGASGLLLPQVATEHRWDRETFLTHTCQKARLPAEAWKRPDTECFIFEAEVFGEE
ncbi:MAG: AmmeMemoRadiSam system protein B [Candidatus Latescibacteria bacterium]|nr:AmmeMemoRadiSam system protein B [Candidatus Latescibacterota bacterium]